MALSKLKMEIQNTKANPYAKNVKDIENYFRKPNNLVRPIF